MRVLVIGSGGREHAICFSLSTSPLVEKVVVSPGNTGMTKTLPTLQKENIEATDIYGLMELAKKEKIDLTIVGPEVALSIGIVDLFEKNQLLIVGPTKKASLLETSKAFAKMVMFENNIPTAQYEEFFSAEKAFSYIDQSPVSAMVVKCDGLAQGKGVIVCQNKEETKKAVMALMNEKFLGENIDHIVIEDCLKGEEVSAFALCDGEDFIFLGTACDHKRLRDGDLGPNTGGMGVYSPVTWITKEDEEWICEHVFKPLLSGMKKRNTPFNGILFAGLMKTEEGFKVLEFNVRLGDPETQVLLPLLSEDIAPWFLAAAKKEIKKYQIESGVITPSKKDQCGVHVVMAAFGYPGTEGVSVRSGDRISFSEDLTTEEIYLFLAGVEKTEDSYITKGGRVLGVTCLGKSFSEAREKVYGKISTIHFEGAQYRHDIGRGQI